MSVRNSVSVRFLSAYSGLPKKAIDIAKNTSRTSAPSAATRAASALQKARPPASGARPRIVWK